MSTPIRPTDDEARGLARELIQNARFGALAVLDPAGKTPMVSRIGLVPGQDGLPLALVSDLSFHTKALQANPDYSLLIGEPGPKGDPLTWPRLSLMGQAQFVRHGARQHAALASHYLTLYPKAQLYIGFADFSFLRMEVHSAHLNGGFGKAFVLNASDLCHPPRS